MEHVAAAAAVDRETRESAFRRGSDYSGGNGAGKEELAATTDQTGSDEVFAAASGQ